MSQSVRSITVSREFWDQAPEMSNQLLRKRMTEHPDTDLWIVCVGPIESSSRIMEALWMYGPAEEPVEGEPVT